MNRFFYSLIITLAVPFALVRLFWKARSEPRYTEALRERFGFINVDPVPDVWIHAVSAGETNAAAPLIRHFARNYQVLVTHMTATGRARSEELFGTSVERAWLPWDMPGAMQRMLGRVQPRVLVIIDTELWPNLVHAAEAAGVPVVVANARMSERSARGYLRLGRVGREMFGRFTWILAQSPVQAERFVVLGGQPDRVEGAGSIKFDLALPTDLDARRADLAARVVGQRTVLVAGSTHEGEETALLDAYVTLRETACEDLLLVLVPRHPNRFDAVHDQVQAAGLTVARFSDGQAVSASTDVWLVDAMGELLTFFALADIAFVGGSLAEIGGHNMMEPAALALPLVMGPHVYKVQDIADEFVAAGAMTIVPDAAALTAHLAHLLDDSDLLARAGQAALAVMNANKGAMAHTIRRVEEQLLPSNR